MTNQEFMLEVDASNNRSKRVLLRKGVEYSYEDGDRLEQFYRAGCAQLITAESALIGMATKHFTSIADMAKNPYDYNLKQWDAKITDLRNYTYLLDALIRNTDEDE